MSVEVTDGPRGTEELGARIAAQLEPGDVVLVEGELGSGKTTLIRGACRALGVTEPVVSPTFTIGRRYRGRHPISHLDLYRLDDLELEVPGLLDEYLTGEAVVFVEWPGAGRTAFDRDELRLARRIALRHAGGDRREIRLGSVSQ